MLNRIDARSDLQLYEIAGDPAEIAAAFCEPDSIHPLVSLVRLALAHSATRLIVESEYIDFAYRAEYAFYYGGLFRDYGGSTRRLLFFRSEEATIHGLLSSAETQCLGYSVLRPTKEGRVGRTVIPFALADAQLNALACEGVFSVHLWGRSYRVRGFPFVQQDTQVMRCAQASLFSCMLFLQNRGGRPLSLPHEISEVATREFAQLGRPFPSVGLTIEEITTFLHRVGYEPLLFVKEPRDQFGFDSAEWVSYAISGLPSIITTENHAMAAHGCLIDLDRVPDKGIVRYDSLVSAAIVHDDGRGPYSILARDAAAQDSLPERLRTDLIEAPISTVVQTDGLASTALVSRPWTFADIHSITVPCPRKMHLRASQVLELTERLLQSVDVLAGIGAAALTKIEGAVMLSRLLAEPFDTPPEEPRENACVINAWLAKSHQLKEAVARRMDGQTDPAEALVRLVELRMPRLVWVVEITTIGLLKSGQEILGEVVFDATGVASDSPILYAHLPGSIILGDGAASEVVFLEHDAPYESWLDLA